MSVTLLICTCNGANLLKPTLEHVCGQVVPAGIEWELLIVNNASTDATPTVIRETLAGAPFSWRLLDQPKPGKNHALELGIQAAKGDFISVIDDDNWIAPDWVERVQALMEAHPAVGILGSFNEPVFEAEPPPWFGNVQSFYACGARAPASGDVTESTGGIMAGAGATLRRSAWDQVCATGFCSFNSYRRGRRPVPGDDVELSLAICRRGWRLWYDAELRLRHFMPAARLTWEKSRRHFRGIGRSLLGKHPYQIWPQPEPARYWKERLRRTWQWQFARECKQFFITVAPVAVAFVCGGRVGDSRVLFAEVRFGFLERCLRERGKYTQHLRRIASGEGAAAAPRTV